MTSDRSCPETTNAPLVSTAPPSSVVCLGKFHTNVRRAVVKDLCGQFGSFNSLSDGPSPSLDAIGAWLMDQNSADRNARSR
jgi:hypothetical protein